MINGAHILETALLVLAAYLVGCVVGYLARRMTMPRRDRTAAPEPAAVSTPPPVAPVVASSPAKPRRSAASRLAAAAERDRDEPVPASLRPAPVVAPEPPPAAVRAEAVPAIDEAADVGRPAEPTEAAAMRAIENGWTPRRVSGRRRRPVPHPEEAPADVDKAMETARSALAAARAAATAAIAEVEAPTAGLAFEVEGEADPKSFLAEPAAPARGLGFEPAHPRGGYGRPEGLPGPRPGGKDNLKLIKGITPALELSLNGLGIFHFDQVAGWDQKAIVWLDHHLTLKGRIGREKWLEQARDLSRGRGRTARPVRR